MLRFMARVSFSLTLSLTPSLLFTPDKPTVFLIPVLALTFCLRSIVPTVERDNTLGGELFLIPQPASFFFPCLGFVGEGV